MNARTIYFLMPFTWEGHELVVVTELPRKTGYKCMTLDGVFVYCSEHEILEGSR
ncbi:hypothetical protein [Nostoc sp. DedQUE07]|uniref:hypothetical protein n=1 Tax=Nostoc sp. DedQUE07 TaxID=3075392 RepID=UPI002AD24605|nr:hypothetical protein [Nostoc sp. DedQUE07]MDZ8132235.1 hypothetical protein [Nostoc sp. DedQUE07]